MNKFLLLFALFISAQLSCQKPNPQLFNLWYLHELTVSGEAFIPTTYGFYPDIEIAETSTMYSISFSDPLHISC